MAPLNKPWLSSLVFFGDFFLNEDYLGSTLQLCVNDNTMTAMAVFMVMSREQGVHMSYVSRRDSPHWACTSFMELHSELLRLTSSPSSSLQKRVHHIHMQILKWALWYEKCLQMERVVTCSSRHLWLKSKQPLRDIYSPVPAHIFPFLFIHATENKELLNDVLVVK